MFLVKSRDVIFSSVYDWKRKKYKKWINIQQRINVSSELRILLCPFRVVFIYYINDDIIFTSTKVTCILQCLLYLNHDIDYSNTHMFWAEFSFSLQVISVKPTSCNSPSNSFFRLKSSSRHLFSFSSSYLTLFSFNISPVIRLAACFSSSDSILRS